MHPDYRSGATIALLWGGLAKYMLENHYDYLDRLRQHQHGRRRHAAASLFSRLGEHMSPLEYRVFPRCPLPLDALRNDVNAELPPLIKGLPAPAPISAANRRVIPTSTLPICRSRCLFRASTPVTPGTSWGSPD